MTARSAARALATCVCVSAALLGTAPGAAAAQVAAPAGESGSYRYWSFWEGSGNDKGGADGEQWRYATKGPSVLRPDDGAVLGFRFALSEDSKDAAKPRGDASFDAVCGGTEEQKDRKRVALRIDFGTAGHAPRGERPPEPRTSCAQVAEDANAAEALADVAEPLRYDSGALLCAIDGYPKRGCGEQVSGSGKDVPEKNGGDEPSASAGEEEGGLGPVAGIGAALAAVAVLAVAAVRRSRRR